MLEWNVYYFDITSRKIELCNILRSLRAHAKEFRGDKKTFAARLKSQIMFCFWSKCEWELIITKRNGRIILSPWGERRSNIELDVTEDPSFDWSGFYDWVSGQKYITKDGLIKIDVYDQVMYRFDEFIDYCWKNEI